MDQDHNLCFQNGFVSVVFDLTVLVRRVIHHVFPSFSILPTRVDRLYVVVFRLDMRVSGSLALVFFRLYARDPWSVARLLLLLLLCFVPTASAVLCAYKYRLSFYARRIRVVLPVCLVWSGPVVPCLSCVLTVQSQSTVLLWC